MDNVDKELEEQDLLSRSFELIRTKKSAARRASSGNVNKIVKPRVKMSKTADSGSKTRQTVPVYTTNNGGVSISSREHTTSDTSGVDVNESSTSSLTEPEIWDSTEHEDNEDDFDYFDDQTLHANDPHLVGKSPLIFSPDTLKPAPGSHYFPPSDPSDQGNEPTSLTSNASSNFFIDASSLLDENECLLKRKEQVPSGENHPDILDSPKAGNHETSVDHIQVSPRSIELSLKSGIPPSQVDFSKDLNFAENEINSPKTHLLQNSHETKTQKPKSQELDSVPSREEASYQTFIINETEDFTTSKQSEISPNVSPDSTQLISSSPPQTFVKDSTFSPNEKVVHVTDIVHNVNNASDVKPIDDMSNKTHVVSAVDKNIVKSPLDERPSAGGLNHNTTNHQIVDGFQKTIVNSSCEKLFNDLFNVTANLPNDTNSKHDLPEVPINVTYHKKPCSVKPDFDFFSETAALSANSSDHCASTVRDASELRSSVTEDIDFQTFVINESLDDMRENDAESSSSAQTEEPKTFIIQDTNRTFDLVSDLCVNKQKTSSRETLDLINETVNLGPEDLAPFLSDPFETHHIVESYEKRALSSNQTFDLIQSSMVPTKKITSEDCFELNASRGIGISCENKSNIRKESIREEPPTPSRPDVNFVASPKETKSILSDQTFSFDKTNGAVGSLTVYKNDLTETSQNIGNEKSNVITYFSKTNDSKSVNNQLHPVISANQSSVPTCDSKPVNTTNPFLNSFIDYSEQSSLISADSIDVQRHPGYSNTRGLSGSDHAPHNATTHNASVTKISTSFSTNPHVNQINTSFSSTNPFLNDIQNDAIDGVANADKMFVVASSHPINMPTTVNVLSYPKIEELQKPQSGIVEMQEEQSNDLGMAAFVVQADDGSLGGEERQLNVLPNVQDINRDHVVYRRDVQKSNEHYIQHSTPLSASVDNLLEMNYTPIKQDENKTFDMNDTQIKRLSCQLNDENLTKANEQLNLLLSGDGHPSSNQYADSNYSDSLLLQNETYSKTLCPSKTQVPPLDLIPTRDKPSEDFHSPDSLNPDDEIKSTHHIDEDNRSKNSSDIDCLPILSGGVSLKDIDVVPASPGRSIEKQSTSWTVEFTGDRMHHSVTGTPRDSPSNHSAGGTPRDTPLSKSSTSLVKHGDSFSHNNKSCGFYIDLNEPSPVPHEKQRTKSAGDSEKKMFNIFIDISNSDSSDKEKSTKSPRPLLRKKMKPLSVTDRFLARQCSNEDASNVKSSAEESDGEHPEVAKARTLFRNVMTPPPSTQVSLALTS